MALESVLAGFPLVKTMCLRPARSTSNHCSLCDYSSRWPTPTKDINEMANLVVVSNLALSNVVDAKPLARLAAAVRYHVNLPAHHWIAWCCSFESPRYSVIVKRVMVSSRHLADTAHQSRLRRAGSYYDWAHRRYRASSYCAFVCRITPNLESPTPITRLVVL